MDEFDGARALLGSRGVIKLILETSTTKPIDGLCPTDYPQRLRS
jgi:hypothetical protein